MWRQYLLLSGFNTFKGTEFGYKLESCFSQVSCKRILNYLMMPLLLSQGGINSTEEDVYPRQEADCQWNEHPKKRLDARCLLFQSSNKLHGKSWVANGKCRKHEQFSWCANTVFYSCRKCVRVFYIRCSKIYPCICTDEKNLNSLINLT